METKTEQFKPYIYKSGERYFLRVGKSMYASPCRCNSPLAKGVHFHHNRGIRNEPTLYLVDPKADYPTE